jgi:6-phosphofructokinase 1
LEKIKFLFDSNQRHAIVIITENILNIFDLAKEVEKYSGFETKAQVLGYIQRGGRPTAEDLVLATRMGNYALHLLEKNIYNGGVSFFEGKLRFFKFKEIFSKEKIIQKELINLISEI